MAFASIAAKRSQVISYTNVTTNSASLGNMATARTIIGKVRQPQPDYSISTFRAERPGDGVAFLQKRERISLNLQKIRLTH